MQKLIFHASPCCGLKVIEPRNNTIPEGFGKGPVVFATDILAFATQFIVSHDDSWANGGAIGDTFFFVVSDKDRFKKADKGGCIYLISSDGFVNYNKREWFSKKAVKPKSWIHFRSGLEAMLVNGVQVYFVDTNTYKKIEESPDHGISVLNNLKSENEKKGFPIVKFDIYKGSKKPAI